MKIIRQMYNWNDDLARRCETKYIVLHHRAGNGDVMSVHKQHQALGYAGIGYHFYVCKNGEIFKGRPIDSIGAHTAGVNNLSIGVCFEGNFENESMSKIQVAGGRKLLAYLKTLYPHAEIKRHKDFQKTLCPGANFPFEQICREDKEMTVEDAVEIIQAKVGLEDETIEFLLCYRYGDELVVKLAEALR